jgi:hypothetical protein
MSDSTTAFQMMSGFWVYMLLQISLLVIYYAEFIDGLPLWLVWSPTIVVLTIFFIILLIILLVFWR